MRQLLYGRRPHLYRVLFTIEGDTVELRSSLPEQAIGRGLRLMFRVSDNAKDVQAFAKLPRAFGFAIEYTDTAMNLRNYEPD